jgi:hypothetical protein
LPAETVAAASTEAASVSSASTPASSTPTDTASIAASIIADSENNDGVIDTPAAAATTPKPATTPEVDPDDFDAVPATMRDSLNRERVNSIPHPRVKQMIEKRERKLIATVAKELGITKAEAELKLDDVLGGLKERGTKLTDFETKFQGINAVEKIMANEPDRFMEMLGQLNPGYKAYAKQQAAAAAAAATTAADSDPEPEPDFDLGGGNKTYSVEGLRKLRAWERRQAVKEVNAGLDGRLKPFEDQAKQQREAAAEEARRNEMHAHLAKRIERARKWPQFVDHEKDILAAMDAEKAKGNFITFEDAYMQVVVPKLAGDRTKIRQEVVDEINKVPRSTGVTTAVSPAAVTDKPKTTADIARELIAQMGKD